MDDNENPDMVVRKELADRVVKTIGNFGFAMMEADAPTDVDKQAQAEIMGDPEKAWMTGYLAGVQIGMEVALCEARGGAAIAKTMTHCMDIAIHMDDSRMHDLAEDLIGDVFQVMLESLSEDPNENVITVKADSFEEAIEKAKPLILGKLAARMPKKERDDA